MIENKILKKKVFSAKIASGEALFPPFVSGVFQDFDVDFWPLLKAEKVLPTKQFWRKLFFLKILFLSSISIYKLLASRIPCI